MTKRLLIRPRWIDGESWVGYLLRLANANEIPGLRPLAQTVQLKPRGLLAAQPDSILRAWGVEASNVPLVHYSRARLESSRADVAKTSRNRLALRGRHLETPLCPHCLANDTTPHLRALWERPLEIGCRVHSKELLRRCTQCGNSLTAERSYLLECRCGASLTVQSAPKLEPFWTEILPAFSLERETTCSETFQPTSFKELVAASVVERLALHERQQEPEGRKQRAAAKPSVQDVRLAMPWFEDWPVGFERRYQAALELGRGSGEDRSTSYIQAKTLFAPMFPRLQRSVKRVARRLNVGHRTSMHLGVEDYLGTPKQSIDAVKKLLNLSRSEANWLCTSGTLSGAQQVSKHAFTIPTESVLDMMAEFSEIEDWKAAADRRGFTYRAMKQVLRIGLIPAICLGDYGRSRVWPKAWDEFCDFLLAASQPLPDELSLSAVGFDAVVAAARAISPDPSRTAFVLAAIAQGTISVYARRARPRMLNELLISLPQLQKVVPRHGQCKVLEAPGSASG